MALRVAIPVFLGAFAVDLLSKQWAVAHASGLIFNDSPSEFPLRVLMSAVAIAVGFVLARVAALRGLGRQWGVWIGCALLVAGILANGISPLLWAQGVPDFIEVSGGWVGTSPTSRSRSALPAASSPSPSARSSSIRASKPYDAGPDADDQRTTIAADVPRQ